MTSGTGERSHNRGLRSDGYRCDYGRPPALGGRVAVDVISVTSPGRLYRGYQEAQGAGLEDVSGGGLAQPWSYPAFEGSNSPIVTIIDGHPHTPAWLPAVLGRRGVTLGVTGFGRSGTSAELYREFAIDAEAIVTAAASLLHR